MAGEKVVPLYSHHLQAEKRARNDEVYAALLAQLLVDQNQRYRRAVERRRRRGFRN
jgi:hypothetical protein